MVSNSLSEMALAFYREPVRFREFKDPDRPLGGDAGPLLRLAVGSSPESLQLPPDLADQDEWQAAARFFVQQVLLAPGANYYRLHGLPRQADATEIRSHHRLLMRLVHPDRAHTDDAWQTAAAARINQAHTTLRDPEKRAEYDQQIALSKQPGGAAPHTRPSGPAARYAPGRDAVRRSGDTPRTRYVWRHLPQASLAATALLALVWVGWIWLSNSSPTPTIAEDASGTLVAPNPAAPSTAKAALPGLAANAGNPGQPGLNAVLATIQPEPIASSPDLPALPAQPAERDITTPAATPAARTPHDQPIALTAPVSPAMAAPAARTSAHRTQPAAASPVLSPTLSPIPSPTPATVVTPVPVAPIAKGSAAAASAMAAVLQQPPTISSSPMPRAESPVPRKPAADPGSVVQQFVRYYEQGDLEHFIGLFHEAARNESGGRASIRKDYEGLFGATAKRQLVVKDMHWTPRDDIWKGEGNFQVRIQRNNENFERQYNGNLQLEVSADGSAPLIRTIYHRVSNQGSN